MEVFVIVIIYLNSTLLTEEVLHLNLYWQEKE